MACFLTASSHYLNERSMSVLAAECAEAIKIVSKN